MKSFTKFFSIFMLLIFSAGLAFAQQPERAPSKVKKSTELVDESDLINSGQRYRSNTVGPLSPFQSNTANQTKSITAVITALSAYTASQSGVINFNFTYASPDLDWIDYVEMVFPAGMTPSATGTGTIDGVSPAVSGQMVTWGTQVTGGSGYGPISAFSNNFSVAVTCGALTGGVYIHYYTESDQYSATPPYSVTDSVLVMPFVPVSNVLWDNTNINFSTGGIISSELRGLHVDSALVQSGDDFIVGLGHEWTLDSINVKGSYQAGATTPADSFIVEIWSADSLGPDSIMYATTLVPSGLATATDLTFSLPNAPNLVGGTYWLSVYAVFNTGNALASTRWNWSTGPLGIGAEGQIQDYTGLFGIPPFSWTPFSQLQVTDQSTYFSIFGTDTITSLVTDMGVSEVFPAPGIGMGDVKVEVTNYGTDTITTAIIGYGINGVALPPYSWTGNLLPGSMDTVLLGTTTFGGGLNTIIACTSSPNAGTDANPSNDCDSVSFFLFAPIDTFPYCQSFEVTNGDWQQGTNDDIDWTNNSGGTTSSTTGPTAAYDGNEYLYIESSSPVAIGDEAHLEAIFDFTGMSNPTISFYYNMYGASIGSLNIDVFDGTTWTDSVWTLSGNQGTAWTNAIVDLSAYANTNNVTIRFRGVVGDDGTGVQYWSDIAIDMVCVYQANPNDAAMVEILNPMAFVNPGAGSVAEVIVRNNGASPITAMNIAYSIDGGIPVTYAYSGSIAFNTTDTVTLPTFTAPAGNFHDFCVWTDLTNDIDSLNDTLCMMFNEAWDLQFHWPVDSLIVSQAGVVSDGFYIYAIPYNSSEFVQYDLAGNKMGTFSIPGVTSVRDMAYDGKYFYGSNASPYIWKMDFNSRTLLETINVTSGADVRAIAYDSDLDAFYVNNFSTPIELIDRTGATISTIQMGAMQAFYGFAYDNTGTNPVLWGFSQDGSGNEIVQYDLTTGLQTGLNYDVIFDIPAAASAIAGGLFIAPNIVPGELTLGGLMQGEEIFGYNIAPATVINNDIGVTTIDGPAAACAMTASEDVTVSIRNFGAMDAYNFPVSYTIGAVAAVTDTITDTIAPGEFYSHTFSVQADFSTPGAHMIYAYTGLMNDQNTGNDTAEAAINHIAAATVPYTMGFEDNEDYDSWRVFNENGDGVSWARTTGTLAHSGTAWMQYSYATATGGDDWVISPCLDLQTGIDYKVDFWYAARSATYPEKMKVYYGSDQNPAAMTNMIIDLGTFSNNTFMEAAGVFQVPADGLYYVGFYAYSDPDMWQILLDDISIVNSTGIDEPATSTVKVFPNPSRDIVNIVAMEDIKSIRVMNSMGQIVLSTTTSGQSHTLNIDHLASGMYIIQVDTENGHENHRINIIE